MAILNRDEYLQVGDAVCVAYCNQYGQNKEVAVGIIAEREARGELDDLLTIKVRRGVLISSIKELVTSIRIMPLAYADKLADDCRESIEKKKSKRKGKK